MIFFYTPSGASKIHILYIVPFILVFRGPSKGKVILCWSDYHWVCTDVCAYVCIYMEAHLVFINRWMNKEDGSYTCVCIYMICIIYYVYEYPSMLLFIYFNILFIYMYIYINNLLSVLLCTSLPYWYPGYHLMFIHHPFLSIIEELFLWMVL